MAQSTILAAGTTAGTSTDVTVAAGSTVTLGIFTADAAGIPGNLSVQVYADTPGNDLLVAQLTGREPVKQFSGPCTLRVKRGVVSLSVGVFSET